MDPQLISAVGTGGIAGVLVLVILYLLRQNHADRSQYQQHIDEVEKRTSAAIASAKASHAKEIAELTAKVDALTTLYEDARRAKWAAEDDAAKYRRMYELGAAQGGTT